MGTALSGFLLTCGGAKTSSASLLENQRDETENRLLLLGVESQIVSGEGVE